MAAKKRFKVGDHVTWNSEAGRVRGRIIEVVTSAIEFKGYRVHATPDEPQYTAAGLSALFAENPAWADGLPLAAAGFETDRYKKE